MHGNKSIVSESLPGSVTRGRFWLGEEDTEERLRFCVDSGVCSGSWQDSEIVSSVSVFKSESGQGDGEYFDPGVLIKRPHIHNSIDSVVLHEQGPLRQGVIFSQVEQM